MLKTLGSNNFSSVLQIMEVSSNINKKKNVMHYFRFYVIKSFFSINNQV
jgi:hypothetical protein